jgi:general secretion pathway protein J
MRKERSAIVDRKFSISSGFTLLELLISLTIMGLIVVVVFGAFRIGVRAWEKGEKDVETHQRQRVVLNLIKRQLASIFVHKVGNANSRPFFLKGDKKSMEFLSNTSIMPGNQSGLVYARYVVKPEDEDEKERLGFYEKNFALQDKEKMEDLNEEDFLMLISDVHNIEFEYLKGQDGEEILEWEETWDPDKDKGFPRAVKVTLKVDADMAPIKMIVRIESESG